VTFESFNFFGNFTMFMFSHIVIYKDSWSLPTFSELNYGKAIFLVVGSEGKKHVL
jgi:hypothetical protein